MPRTTMRSPPTPGGQPSGKLEAVPQHLCQGRNARGPHRNPDLVDPQVRSGEEGPDRAGVELPAGRHAPSWPEGRTFMPNGRGARPPHAIACAGWTPRLPIALPSATSSRPGSAPGTQATGTPSGPAGTTTAT